MIWSRRDPLLSELADQWSSEIQEGDVVRTKSGDLRVVRAVHRSPKATGKGARGSTAARRTFRYFAVKHCSWTGAGYTLYSVAEMIGMGWLPTTARPRKLTEEIEKMPEWVRMEISTRNHHDLNAVRRPERREGFGSSAPACAGGDSA